MKNFVLYYVKVEMKEILHILKYQQKKLMINNLLIDW